MIYYKLLRIIEPLIFLFIFIIFSTSFTFADDLNDWKSDWALDDYYKISVDTSGYIFPSSIAFVPNPGNDPKDPLYFITELRGKLKVITNDRSVYTFAEDFFKITPYEELPASEGEVGMAGICLEPENGYIFVTFSYNDSNNILRNNIYRFDTKPHVFSLKPNSTKDFRHIFSSDESGYAHQIGPCQIYNNLLYVSVGDGNKHLHSQQLNTTLGKILRMTLDGEPSRGNPYYVDDGEDNSRDYIWAYGFRNPFSLKIVDGRVFVAENGMSSDRFLEVHEGENYLWDGTDWSIGTNTHLVFSPSVSPVQMDYYPETLDIFPVNYRSKFYLALGGSTSKEGPGDEGGKSIIMLDFGFKENRMLGVPKHFLKYRGKGLQIITGLAVGSDGLYFTPLYPDASGQSKVLRIEYDSSNSHPYKMRDETSTTIILAEKGCLSCHKLYGEGIGTVGPNLDNEPLMKRLNKRLNSPEYIASLEKLDNLDIEPYVNFKDARTEVLNLKGEDRIRTWLKYHLIEPKFDNSYAQMPNLGITEAEAVILTDLLMEKESKRVKYYRLFNSILPELRYRYLVYSLFIGVLLSSFMFLWLIYLRKR